LTVCELCGGAVKIIACIPRPLSNCDFTAQRRITEIGFALLLLERLGIVLPKPMRMTKPDLPAVALSA
jgi:hypothetical protein